MSFKITVKNGDTRYDYSSETGGYEPKKIDDVREFEGLAEALAEFLYIIEDYGTPGEHKASLTYIPTKKKDKKDKKI